MQKFWKLVKIWQSYRELKGGNFSLRHSVVWVWQPAGMGVTDGTGKEMETKRGCAWERKWEWIVWRRRDRIEKDISAHLYWETTQLILTVAELRRTASVRLFRNWVGQFAHSSVADWCDCYDHIARAFVFLQWNCRARVGEVEVLVVAVEIVVRRQRFVANFHLRKHSPPMFGLCQLSRGYMRIIRLFWEKNIILKYVRRFISHVTTSEIIVKLFWNNSRRGCVWNKTPKLFQNNFISHVTIVNYGITGQRPRPPISTTFATSLILSNELVSIINCRQNSRCDLTTWFCTVSYTLSRENSTGRHQSFCTVNKFKSLFIFYCS